MHEEQRGVVTVVAAFHVGPDHLDTVLPVVAACVKASRQEATNLSYTCRRDLGDPTRFVFIEQWRSLAAIRAHETLPHFLAMKALFDRGLAGPPAVTFLSDVDILS
ncbi:putative quinol monooxygenase [Gluconacetobacter takamatsuzukensis]|uniref:Antibiotic biosynthesis monooxygenase n=1 Tax=Gluconacetobacter takamatsuzukensis TaxID=1286190 RepID=A0A7W4PPV0_9PROT|nr:putative quinol monooxygenase [Gluconacetobacter takamatsuzukensis]MBB2203964.1 antibiotic biosynthesis monooxygenase [Gluconacetobacter takamatsuzukensis]